MPMSFTCHVWIPEAGLIVTKDSAHGIGNWSILMCVTASHVLELENEKIATHTKNVVLLRSGLGNTIRFQVCTITMSYLQRV